MLSTLVLENFKAFGTRQVIPRSPPTLRDPLRLMITWQKLGQMI